MGRLLVSILISGLALQACRTGDAKFDPWEDDEDAWGSDTGEMNDDSDRDGWPVREDCDDTNSEVHPEAEEICDGIDNNCDGQVDEGQLLELYLDADGDGYGQGDPLESCTELPGYALQAEDCNDSEASAYPGAPEQCDDLDNDCDGSIDEEVLSTWYGDADGDGYGDLDALLEDCDPPSGYVADATDCNDSLDNVYPGADEWCDGLDNDCDGSTDEDAVDSSSWYLDADSDGYGDQDQSTESCGQPIGYVDNDSDCEDTDDSLHPDAVEICDEIDNDCDSQVDDEDSDLVASTWYGDSDGDGYGGTTFSTVACECPSNYVDNSEDCDDLDDEVSPGAAEICNEIDDDCDGDIDDADSSLDSSTAETWYADADGDGYGDPDTSKDACEAPSGATEDASDCDDTDASVNPDAEEECDGIDNDCDGDIDPGFTDTDGDGTANCVDSSIFSDDFSDSSWGEWNYMDLGGGSINWNMDGNTLYEDSDSAMTIAYGPDLGELEAYTISVEVWSGGYYNNALGIAFALQDEDNYFLLEWDDFNDFYGSYSPGGEVILWECISGSCSELGRDDDSGEIAMDYATWTPIALTVDGSEISFAVDGSVVFEHTYTGSIPIGADHTGVYSYDNDYGVYFDDFDVTQP
jgi:hypothetical protein